MLINQGASLKVSKHYRQLTNKSDICSGSNKKDKSNKFIYFCDKYRKIAIVHYNALQNIITIAPS